MAETVSVGGKAILFVMAAEPEYGPKLQALFKPVMTGVGPVEAAVAVTAALADAKAAGRLPDLVVSLGSAGSRVLEQTEVYQAVTVSYRDMDASPLGFPKGETPFLGLPATLPLDVQIPGIPQATLSTGADIVSGAAYDAVAEDMVEMETYAVLRACQRFDVPLAALRGISDGAAELRHVGDWTEYLHVIDEKLADCVKTLLAHVEKGEILQRRLDNGK